MHDYTVSASPDGDGRFVGTCACGYAAIGGDEPDVTANLALHAAGGWA